MKQDANEQRRIEEKVQELMSRMTLEEIILQTDQYYSHDFTMRERRDGAEYVTDLDMEKVDQLLKGRSVGSIQARQLSPAQINELQRYAVEHTRLGIPFLFSEEALHGFCHNDATVFPQQIGLAATFRPELGQRMGRAIGTEARAMGIHETYSPVMDLIRDPRYGRCEESYGEDTHLCAQFARSVVKGMQGEHLSDPDAIAAEPKHYAGYGAPVGGLNCSPCAMGRHEVFSDCLPVFEAAFADAGAMDAMCSYNAIDGSPVASDHELLTDILRGQWGMRGFVRSDLTAVKRLYDNHYVADTRQEAMAMGLEAGVDLQLYDFPHEEWLEGLTELVSTGRLDEAVIRRACARVLKVKFMLGLFDHPYLDESRAAAYVHTPEHLRLSREIARESMVLLKNAHQTLPLSKDVPVIAVLGPSAGAAMLGDYTADGRKGVSLLEGIRNLVSPDTKVLYDAGCHFLGDMPVSCPEGMLRDENGEPGLTGRYYRGRSFEGEPALVQRDPGMDFHWLMNGSPIDSEVFSVVWTGTLTADADFDGGLGFRTEDSMRLYVDGRLILDGWGEEHPAWRTVPFHFEAGRAYRLRIEYTNDHLGARVFFGYVREMENFQRAVHLAQQADVAIVCVGDNQDTCGENLDRASLDLPGNQEAFVRAVCATGTPVVLVLQTGRPVTIPWEREHVPAILEAWFPGEEGGYAIAETLFGDNVPSGRLPISFPRHVGQIPCHYSRRPGGGKRYVETDCVPLWSFGFGLSYTSFAFADLEVTPACIAPGESVTATFTVTNTGSCAGTAVPQLYIRDRVSSTVKPLMTLAAFSKVALEPGETKAVTLTIGPREMRTLDPQFRWHVEPGDFRVWLADSSDNLIMGRDFQVK